MRKVACCLLICAGAAAAAEPVPPAVWSVRLHLLSDDQRVELRKASGQLVCVTPCNAEVRFYEGEPFRLEGKKLASSEELTFDPSDTEVTLRVRARAELPRRSARTLLLVGGALFGGTLLTFLGVGLLCLPSEQDSACHRASNAGYYIVGGIGLSAIVAGGLLLNYSPPTQFSRVRD
jgi:hypothetical protein